VGRWHGRSWYPAGAAAVLALAAAPQPTAGAAAAAAAAELTMTAPGGRALGGAWQRWARASLMPTVAPDEGPAAVAGEPVPRHLDRLQRLGGHRLDRIAPERRDAADLAHQRFSLQTPRATSFVNATRRLKEPGRPRDWSENAIVPASRRAR
jgi:hypothetical protein